MAAKETPTCSPGTNSVLVIPGNYIQTSKITRNTTVTANGYVMDAKTMSDKFTDIYSDIPRVIDTAVNNFVKSGISMPKWTTVEMYSASLPKGSGIYIISVSTECNVSTTYGLYTFLYIDNALVTLSRGTQTGGGGAACMAFVDARSTAHTLSIKGYSDYPSGCTGKIFVSITRLNI